MHIGEQRFQFLEINFFFVQTNNEFSCQKPVTDKDYRTVYTSLSSIYPWMISQTRVFIIHIQTNKNINLLEKDPLCPCVCEFFMLQIFDPSLTQVNHKEMLNYEQIYGPHAGVVQYIK